jgi:hypothetical protein
MTTIYNGASLVDLVPGYALGWVDEHRLLVQSYTSTQNPKPGVSPWSYVETKIYDDAAQEVGTLAVLPNMSNFYVVSSSQIMSVNDANIYDLATGATVFSSGAPPRCVQLVGDNACQLGFASPSYAVAGSSILQADATGVFLATP